MVVVHACKEIENYLLDPDALERALSRAVSERRRRGGCVDEVPDVREVLRGVVQACYRKVQTRRIGAYQTFFRDSGKDPSTLADEALEELV